MNHFFPRVVLPSAMLAGLFFFGCGRDSGEQLYRDALRQLDGGNPVRARTMLEKSVRRRAGRPENAKALDHLGVLLWESGEVEQAAEAFHESTRTLPGRFSSLANLGVALAAAGDPSGAEQVFREAALQQADDPRFYAFAGVSYALQGAWQDAQRNLALALDFLPDDPRLNNAMALCEVHTKGPEQALRRLRSVAGRHPDYAPVWFNLGSIQLHALHQENAALASFRLAAQRAPDGSSLKQAALQRINELAPDPEDAVTPSRGREAAETLFRRAFASQREGRLEDAVVLYRQALQADETYEQAWNHLGLVHYTQGELNEAARAFQRAVDLNPAFTGARYNLALVYARRGEPDKALHELNTVLQIQPDYRPALSLRDQLGNNP